MSSDASFLTLADPNYCGKMQVKYFAFNKNYFLIVCEKLNTCRPMHIHNRTGHTLLRRRKGLVTYLTLSCALLVLMHCLTSPVWIISKIFEECKVQE